MGYLERMMGAEEKIMAKGRQHPWVWIPRFVVAILVIFVIIGLSAYAAQRLGDNWPLLAMLLCVLPIWWFLSTYLDWWNEEYIVTNRRIVQTEGVINKHVTDSSLEKINDVVLTQSVFGRMFNFGDLDILTASEQGINHLHFIRDPVRFKVAMLNAKEGLRDMDDIQAQVGAVGAAQMTKNDIPRLIEQLEQLKAKGLITEQEYEAKRQKLLDQI